MIYICTVFNFINFIIMKITICSLKLCDIKKFWVHRDDLDVTESFHDESDVINYVKELLC